MNIKELLNKNNLQIKLPQKILEYSIDEDFHQYSIIEKQLIYNYYLRKKFKVYHFDNTKEDKFLEIVPDNPSQTLRVYEKINNRWEGVSLNNNLELTSIT